MRITSVDVFDYQVDYAHGDGTYTMSGGRVATGHPSAAIRLSTDEGVVGWGELCPHGRTFSASFFEGERAALPLLADAVLGLDPRNVTQVNGAMNAVIAGAPCAKAAIDVACWDLFGMAAGLPVSDLLGGTVQQEIPLALSVPVGTAEAAVEYVSSHRALGVSNFQIKVGDSWAEDVRRVRAAHDAAGPGTSLVVDANGGWSLQSALLAVRQLDDLPIHLEQPCRTFSECAELRKHTALPMILDESVTSLGELVRAQAVGIAGVNIKVQKVGGLTSARLIRDAAQALGMNIECDDLWGGTIVTAGVAALAASTQRQHFLVAAFFSDWTRPALSTAPAISEGGGLGHALPGPGLGIEVDESALGEPALTLSATPAEVTRREPRPLPERGTNPPRTGTESS